MKRTFPFALTAERYERITAPIRSRKWAMKALKWCNRICSVSYIVAYPICILWMLYIGDYFTGRAILIPAVSVILLSVIRLLIDRPRPYEKLQITPLFSKQTKGKSFPSRHIFSSFIIASTFSFVFPWGWILFIPATLLAVIRVICGVHYPSDVIAGAGLAIAASMLYYL